MSSLRANAAPFVPVAPPARRTNAGAALNAAAPAFVPPRASIATAAEVGSAAVSFAVPLTRGRSRDFSTSLDLKLGSRSRNTSTVSQGESEPVVKKSRSRTSSQVEEADAAPVKSSKEPKLRRWASTASEQEVDDDLPPVPWAKTQPSGAKEPALRRWASTASEDPN